MVYATETLDMRSKGDPIGWPVSFAAWWKRDYNASPKKKKKKKIHHIDSMQILAMILTDTVIGIHINEKFLTTNFHNECSSLCKEALCKNLPVRLERYILDKSEMVPQE